MNDLTESLKELGFSYDSKAEAYFGWYKDFPIIVSCHLIPVKNRRIYDIQFITSLSKKGRQLTLDDLPHLEDEHPKVYNSTKTSEIVNSTKTSRIVKLSYSGPVRTKIVKSLLKDFDRFIEHFRQLKAFPVCSYSGQSGDLGFYWVKNEACILSEKSFKVFLKEAEDYQFEQNQKNERIFLGFLASLIVALVALRVRMMTRFEQFPALFIIIPASVLINWFYILMAGHYRRQSQWLPKSLTFAMSFTVAFIDLFQSKGLSWNLDGLMMLVGKINVADLVIFLVWLFLGFMGQDLVQSYYSRRYDKRALARPLVNNLNP